MSDIVIRPLEGNAEYRACVALQQETWGAGFSENVPAAILMAAQKVGGVASGAFDGDRLVGFVFGITGIDDAGRPVHWSDMLAVRPEYRRGGLGHRLKLHQRELLLARGVHTVYWTFDPLEAGNARLNLSRLGAIARTYHRDLYGQSTSPLHAGIGTDRLVAEWLIASERVERRLAGKTEPPSERDVARMKVLNPPGDDGTPLEPGAHDPPDADGVRVAVPGNIQTLKDGNLAAAVAWRLSVRAALEDCFARGYVASEMVRGSDVAYYALTRAFER